ncbi:hypothetical protein NEMIN01_0822 [Nematocida minor]|uniref:uncharacterized protein n=1 Tax=Nematocida minor TaxID=1912983 RepID=UPI00221EED9F|nr:uncharacterized protein NEMIN01_0822 [Nematocida minor]KAI5190037.1 hypothetical protein NEMIN01_0822 [Nematocida minor]
MIYTIVHANNSNTILNGAQINKYSNGEHSTIDLNSKTVLVFDNYVVTENKEILKIEGNSVKLISRAAKTPTKIVVDKDSMYIADRLGSVYRLDNLSSLSANPAENIPVYLFGSISMITDMKIADTSIITIDKDNKIRITDKSHPYRIKKFVLVHSKPLVSVEMFKEYIVAGGYDWYISFYNTETGRTAIFDLVEKEIKEIGDTLPGVENPKSISNINLEAECRVRKILSFENTILIITNEAPLLLSVDSIEDLSITCKEIENLSDSFIVDGTATADGYEIIDKTGRLFKLAPSSPKPVRKLIVPNYANEVDVSIANKYFD